MSHDQLAAWSRLQHQVRDQVFYMDVGAYSIKVQQAWPQGIEAFRNLQFLQISIWEVWPCAGDDILDLSHFAYIPHVSLETYLRLHVKISVGNWKVLELQSSHTFNVIIPDAKAFMTRIGGFCFKFDREERPEDLIDKLGKAAVDTGTVLYEHPCDSCSSVIVLSSKRPNPDTPVSSEHMFLNARIGLDNVHPSG